MTLSAFALWLDERNLDLHWSVYRHEHTLTAISGNRVWSATSRNVDEAIEFLRLAIDGSWAGLKAG